MSLNRNILDEIYSSQIPKQVKKNKKKQAPSRTKEGNPTKKSALVDRQLTKF